MGTVFVSGVKSYGGEVRVFEFHEVRLSNKFQAMKCCIRKLECGRILATLLRAVLQNIATYSLFENGREELIRKVVD